MTLFRERAYFYGKHCGAFHFPTASPDGVRLLGKAPQDRATNAKSARAFCWTAFRSGTRLSPGGRGRWDHPTRHNRSINKN